MEILWILLILANIPVICPDNKCKNEKKCKISRVHSLRSADCYKLDYKDFPKCLPYDIEVMELSYNRIRKISTSDVAAYPRLKHLYLNDNLLVNLDGEIFPHLQNLETLDISTNAITTLPSVIFQLPNLKTLYLGQNTNINIAEAVEQANPITIPLTQLDMSYLKEEGDLLDMPYFEEMPYLAYLDIKGNHFSSLSIKHFAGLCNLQILITENTTTEFQDDCDCWKLNNWLEMRKISFKPFNCNAKPSGECPEYTVSEEDEMLYNKCRESVNKIEKAKLLTRVGIGTGIVAGICLLVAAYVAYRKITRKRNYVSKNHELVQDTSESLQPLQVQTKV